MLYNLHFFPPSKFRLFHNATLFGFCITHILNTGFAKICKKKNPSPKGCSDLHFRAIFFGSHVFNVYCCTCSSVATSSSGKSLTRYKKVSVLESIMRKKERHLKNKRGTYLILETVPENPGRMFTLIYLHVARISDASPTDVNAAH